MIAMTFCKYKWLAMVGLLAIALIGAESAAQRGGGRGGGGGARGGGGGGGYRSSGGGGVSRSSYSGNGSVRYSAPRSSSSSYSRPATASYSRSSAPVAAQRSAGGAVARSSTPAYRSSGTVAAQRSTAGSSGGGYTYRSANSYYKPANSGSIVHGGTITGPGGSTIGGIQGPRGGGAVGIKGAESGTAGAVRGPGGGGAAKVEGPGGGTAAAVRGPGGGGAAKVEGLGGGTAGAVRGPGGGGAARVEGPGGGTAGAVRGPAGAGAAGIRGPGGSTAGAVWGPGGHGVAGARGPYGNRVVTNLPTGAVRYPWHGNDYWHAGFGWYQPTWVGDSVCYDSVYPPTGFYYPTLPSDYSTVVIDNNTYYEADGVYYQEGEQDGQKGYVVAAAPGGAEGTSGGEASGENPFQVFKSMCDYLAGLETFSAVAQTTIDEMGLSGEKVQVSARRMLYVSRPNKVALDVTGDKGAKTIVYDGNTVTMLDRAENVYTVIQVPDTIDAALDTLAQDYGVVVPLEDLMYKDLYDRAAARASAGQYLGLHTVDGVKCHHLAFTTDTADWEVWIDAGDKPAPRKMTIDYRENTARSRYSADIVGWVGSPAFPADKFKLKLPDDAKRIEITPNQGKS